MAHDRGTAGNAHAGRRTPNTHSDAVQEAKRLEKMQAFSSSHRFTSPPARALPEKDAH